MTVGSSSWTDTHRLVLCFLLFFFTTVSFEAGQFPQKGGAVRLAPDALFNRLSPSVFVVEALDLQGNTISLGSGVALGKDLLVTNEHVISEAVGIRVWHDDRQWMAIEKIPHRTQDLTLLSVANLNATGVSLREGETRIGERVYAIGSPEGLELTLSDGLISGIRELTPGTLSIQTSASISHGSSGGGLFDEYGRLIGITTLTLTDGQNLNFAIPASFVRDLVRPSQHIDAKLPDVAIRLQEEWDIASKQINRTSNPADIEKFTILSQGLLQFMPEEAGILDAVADIYHLRKDFQNAIKYYEKSLSVDPGNEISWSKLAFSFNGVKNYRQGIDAALHCIRLNPADGYAWANLGFAYTKSGDLTNALAAYQKETSLQPSSVDALTDLALTYQRLGQVEAFQSVLNRIRMVDPGRVQRILRNR